MRLIQRSNNKKDLLKQLEKLESQNRKLEERLKQVNQQKQNAPNSISEQSALQEFANLEAISVFIFNNETKQFSCQIAPEDSEFKTFTVLAQFLNTTHPEDKILLSELFNTLKHNTKAQIIEYRYYFQSKESKDTRYCQLTCNELNSSENKNEQFICVFKDITKLVKQRKDLIKNKEKAENSDQLKTIFLSNISHYIRTPLNSIVGFAEILSISEYEREKRKEFLHIIKNQSKNLLNIIDDVAEIAKYESGLYTIAKSPCNLNILLKELLINNNEIRTKARKEQVQLSLNLPDQKGLITYTDSGRLQQIIQNLLTYSLRTTDQGFIELGYLTPSEGKIEFYINDSSPCLSKEEQKLIFDKFTNIEVSENIKYEDTSLSLTIAKYIVKLLGGKIWVRSENDLTNSYRFTLPYEAPPVSEQIVGENEILVENQYNWRNKIILVVEDEEVNGMFIEAVLHDTNSQIIYAKNGRQALELCKTIPKIDLILMDIKMPVMNGLVATKEIRKINQTIPIIAQTAMASEEDMHNCQVAGCNEMVTKPIEVEEFLSTLNRYLSD